MMDGGMWAAMGIWSFLVVVLVVALLVLAVLGSVWLYRALRSGDRDPDLRDEDSAHRALRRRYAAGDIDEDEYERRLSVLDRP